MPALNNEYWSKRYTDGSTGWDTGAITTPLKTYIDQLTDKNISILVPGCGNSYEAAYLLQQGFTNITLVDISSVLCESLQKKFADQEGIAPNIICADFFELQGNFDLVIEQTFFCALDPSLREKYVQHMHRILKPGGKLAGLLFNRAFEGGPPFGGSEEEYRQLFTPYFTIHTMQPCYNSIEPRKDAELFVILVNK